MSGPIELGERASEATMTSGPGVQIWVGRALSALAVAFVSLDAGLKLLRVPAAIEGTVALGYPESAVIPIGGLLAVGIVLHLVPRTSFMGAIYLSAFLGGAVASQYRVGNPVATHLLFPIYVAAFLWGGLLLRSARLRFVALGGA